MPLTIGWWKRLEQHIDSEFLKIVHLVTQDGRNGGRLETIQTTSYPEPYDKLYRNFVGQSSG